MPLDRLLHELRSRAEIEAWSLYGTTYRRLSVGTKDRETGNPHAPVAVADGLAAAYRIVWRDGKFSRGSLERRLVEVEPALAIDLAREAAIDDPDAARIPDPEDIPEVEIHDAATAAIASGEIGPVADRLDAVRRTVESGGFRTWSGSTSASEAEGRIVTSTGLDASARGTAFSWSVVLDGEIAAGRSLRAPEAPDAHEARLGRLATTAAALRESASGFASGIRPVILHPDVVEEYVLGTLFQNLDGEAVAHGEGAFRPEQFGGSPVLREDLSLRIDPTYPMASGSYRFSTEGIPARPETFVLGGRLVTPVLDVKYASRLGRRATAMVHAYDVVELSGEEEMPLDDARDAASGGALVLGVLGVHTQDAASGDFSLAAPQTLAIGGGRLRATISGNLFALLRDPETRLVRFEDETTPGLLVRCRIDARA